MGEAYAVATGHLNVADNQIDGITEQSHHLERVFSTIRLQRLEMLPVAKERRDIGPDGRIVINYQADSIRHKWHGFSNWIDFIWEDVQNPSRLLTWLERAARRQRPSRAITKFERAPPRRCGAIILTELY